MVCLRNVSIGTLHKGDTEDNNNNNNIINDAQSTFVIKFVQLIQMFKNEFPVSLTTQILALLMTVYYP
jgi:hypothetical protein